MNNIHNNIKRLRTANGLTQDDLAEKMHVTRQTVSNWETAKNQPDIDTLQALADVFNTDINELIYGNKKDEYQKYQPMYVRTVIVCGLILIALMLVKVLFIPFLEELKRKTYRYVFEVVLTKYISTFAIYLTIGFAIPAFISLWFDCRIPHVKIAEILAIIMILPGLLLIPEYLIEMYLLNRQPFYLLVSFALSAQKRCVWYVAGLQVFPLLAGIIFFFSFKNRTIKTA